MRTFKAKGAVINNWVGGGGGGGGRGGEGGRAGIISKARAQTL